MGSSSSALPALECVPSCNTQAFMGTWFVIAVKPTFLETSCCNAVERYSWNESKDRIDIDFRYTNEGAPDKIKAAPQKGWVDSPTGSKWKVSPMWPVKLPFLILEQKEDEYCMIGYPSRAYLWIMSRTPKMDPKLYNELIDKAKNKHQYDLTGLRVVPQDWKDRAMAKKRDVEMETADPTMQ
ncbi:hypothetical protein TeGR_g2383 [Tetraparma gracilis]|uniref:Lipocalin/cytosolic fatty-acid binding domain-containing protein n=1 Tax=Tetraparma gracilis TaxID=2962635 RepID=A0ABQ6M8V7_9STRA|nr:hypothetical protein TeGR_g2383 [Tetraparma gracilis]